MPFKASWIKSLSMDAWSYHCYMKFNCRLLFGEGHWNVVQQTLGEMLGCILLVSSHLNRVVMDPLCWVILSQKSTQRKGATSREFDLSSKKWNQKAMCGHSKSPMRVCSSMCRIFSGQADHSRQVGSRDQWRNMNNLEMSWEELSSSILRRTTANCYQNIWHHIIVMETII
jgi:hypothetical protein